MARKTHGLLELVLVLVLLMVSDTSVLSHFNPRLVQFALLGVAHVRRQRQR